MYFLSFYNVKNIDITDGSCEITCRSDVTFRKPLHRAVCFATSRPANHAICSFIDSREYASGPIRRCLFIDYIIISINIYHHTYPQCV